MRGPGSSGEPMMAVQPPRSEARGSAASQSLLTINKPRPSSAWLLVKAAGRLPGHSWFTMQRSRGWRDKYTEETHEGLFSGAVVLGLVEHLPPGGGALAEFREGLGRAAAERIRGADALQAVFRTARCNQVMSSRLRQSASASSAALASSLALSNAARLASIVWSDCSIVRRILVVVSRMGAMVLCLKSAIVAA